MSPKHPFNGIDDAIHGGLEFAKLEKSEAQRKLNNPFALAAARIEGRGPKSKLKVLRQVLYSSFDFFVNEGVAYFSPGGNQAIPLESGQARSQFVSQYFDEEKGAPGKQNLSDFIAIASANLHRRGPERKVFRRLGWLNDRFYLDLDNRAGEIVEVSAAGWKIVRNVPGLYFLRSGKEGSSIPHPQQGGDVRVLSELLGLEEQNLVLVVSWILGSALSDGPHPILIIEGEPGSGKSTLARVLKQLIDPSKNLLRGFPRREQDFAVAALNHHILAFDNVDRIKPGESDMLCRAATGGAFASRTHYSMTEETELSLKRPVILTGIQNLVHRADLADRVIYVWMQRVDCERVMSEKSLWQCVSSIQPKLLGALLDAASAALRNLSSVKLPRLPRMADFARFVVAAEYALPWPDGRALEAYYESRRTLLKQTLEADRVVLAVVSFMRTQSCWEGRMSDLLPLLLEASSRKGLGVEVPATLGKRIWSSRMLLEECGISVSRSARSAQGQPYRFDRL